jgi:hypothetical protein
MPNIQKKTKARPVKPHPFFSKANPLANPDTAKQHFLEKFNAGLLEEALQVALAFTKISPNSAYGWSDAAVCCTRLERWPEAIQYGLRALSLDKKVLPALDALAHSYGGLRDWENVRRYGSMALALRNEIFGLESTDAWPMPDVSTLSSERERNVIAFSLFGENSKYGETAVLNVLEQPAIYPNWICRFYVDETVPAHITDRLRSFGGDVRLVTDEQKRWPGPMWRFAAYDDPMVERVIFRDADSVISTREAGAVAEWIDSGKAFHIMRDSGSHTELILAGLWGCVRGALPSMAERISTFLTQPLDSAHFADQFFLREYVWPYARRSLLAHDSLFDFLDGRPFPEGPHRDDFHTGYAEGSPVFGSEVDLPDGSVITWSLWDQRQMPEQMICRYRATVQAKKIKAHLPARYAKLINHGMIIRVETGA